MGVYVDNKNRAWLLGVIDPLNVFDFEKKFEYYAKYPKWGLTMSCVPPNDYRDRWVHFM